MHLAADGFARSPGRERPFPASSFMTRLHEEVVMESLDRNGLGRLAVAARETDLAPGREPVRAGARLDSAVLWLAARVLGALAVLAVGAVHLQQYVELYSAIPTIGTLFVLNFAGATAIGLGLLAPTERLLGLRWGGRAVALLALAGIGLAATAFVFLTISEHTPLFGFMEPGYDPPAILASRVAEGAAVGLLGVHLLGRAIGKGARRTW
jgi:hypothetical protein